MRKIKVGKYKSHIQKRPTIKPTPSMFGTVALNGKKYKHGKSVAEEKWLNRLNVPERSKVVYGFMGKILILDGFDPSRKIAYEYLGAPYHGSHKVYPRNRDVPLWIGKTPNQLYTETVNRFNFLHSLGFKVYFVWDLDYKTGKTLGRFYRGPGDNLY